jgi:hypothetical protein
LSRFTTKTRGRSWPLFNSGLSDLLAPYEGDRARARTVSVAVQGLLIVQLASAAPDPDGLGEAVSDLVRRYRAEAPATHDLIQADS